jgi:hypothetical protein
LSSDVQVLVSSESLRFGGRARNLAWASRDRKIEIPRRHWASWKETMDMDKEFRVARVGARAAYRMEQLADRLVDAPSAEREALQAGIAFERWLLESCRDALAAARPPRHD